MTGPFRNPSAPHNQPPFDARPLDGHRSYVVGSTGVNVLGALTEPLPLFIGHDRSRHVAEMLNG
jgi:hypothetical protein